MARSGVHVAVEVLTSGRPLTSYHAAALRDSTPLSGDAPPRPASPPEKVESVVAEVVEQVTASHRTAVTPAEEERPGDLFAVDDEPAPRPVPMRAWQSERRRRGFGEQAVEAEPDDDVPEEADDRSPLPSPVPLARRTRPRPVGEVGEQADPLVGPLTDPLLDPIPNEGSWTDEWTSGDWAVAETSGSGSAGDGPADTASPAGGPNRSAESTGPTAFPTRPGAGAPHSGVNGPAGPFRAVTDPDRGSAAPEVGPGGPRAGAYRPAQRLRPARHHPEHARRPRRGGPRRCCGPGRSSLAHARRTCVCGIRGIRRCVGPRGARHRTGRCGLPRPRRCSPRYARRAGATHCARRRCACRPPVHGLGSPGRRLRWLARALHRPQHAAAGRRPDGLQRNPRGTAPDGAADGQRPGARPRRPADRPAPGRRLARWRRRSSSRRRSPGSATPTASCSPGSRPSSRAAATAAPPPTAPHPRNPAQGPEARVIVRG